MLSAENVKEMKEWIIALRANIFSSPFHAMITERKEKLKRCKTTPTTPTTHLTLLLSHVAMNARRVSTSTVKGNPPGRLNTSQKLAPGSGRGGGEPPKPSPRATQPSPAPQQPPSTAPQNDLNIDWRTIHSLGMIFLFVIFICSFFLLFCFFFPLFRYDVRYMLQDAKGYQGGLWCSRVR